MTSSYFHVCMKSQKRVTKSTFRQKVLDAFSTDYKSIRTAGGVSRETGLPIDEVTEYLEDHPDTFEVLKLRPAGHKLYRIRPV